MSAADTQVDNKIAADRQPPAELGRLLGGGKYELLAPAGSGAMGVVFLARHVALERIVAVKLISPTIMSHPEAVTRFVREAQAASLLNHRNAVQVLDFGHDPTSGSFLVMEYLEGRNLSDVLAEEGRLEEARAKAIAGQLLAGLGAAHDAGIVHRDVKAGNVMLVPWTDDDGEPIELVKVFDFGIATLGRRDPGLGQGEVSGTPEYMSPEQAQGLDVDQRSDVYAVGVLLYALVTGDVPFVRDSALETMLAHLDDAPRPPSELEPTLSPELERIILRALAKDPAARFPTARAFRAALLGLGEGPAATGVRPPSQPSTPAVALATVPETRPARAGQGPRRRSLAFALAAMALLGAGAIGWFATRSVVPSPPPSTARAAAVQPLGPTPTPAVRPQSVAAERTLRAGLTGLSSRLDGVAFARRDHLATVPPLPVLDVTQAFLSLEGPRREAPPVAERVTAVVPTVNAPREVAVPGRVTPSPTPAPLVTADASPSPTPTAPTSPGPSLPPTPSTTTATTPSTPPAPAPVTVPALSARAGIGNLVLQGSIPRSSVGRALDMVKAPLEACYRTAAEAARHDASASASVSFEIDVDGRAHNVSVGALPLPGLCACASAALARIRLKDRPDTGTVAASFSLSFTPAPPTLRPH